MNRKLKILLVEDNRADARYVQEILPNEIYNIIWVQDLNSAVQVLTTTDEVINVILLDLSLPDAAGLETFESIYSLVPEIPLLVLTGLDDSEIGLKAVKEGAQDYVLKREISQYNLPRAISYAVERKETEVDRKRLAILEEREEFMATLTHDLKNPLIAANRILELLAQKEIGKSEEERQQLYLQLKDSNRLLISMIQNLIEAYRFEKELNVVCLENTDLLSLINSCLEPLLPIASSRQIEVNTSFPDSLRSIQADSEALRRVIQNLLDNALKFTPKGGRIEIALRAHNGSIGITINDTGPGIPVEEQEFLFQRFARGKRGKKYSPGSGLGLFLCKKIVDAHKGEIRCSSEEGRGTTFSVTLPA